ncbi:hypothetical protein INT48_001060 [Thamnidium elegans]|uniref:non-specific serine/threonine protein kinase n=1 Tax=Thamnidium elegans TaxID=101142 RepID=A0A8H7SPL8_9FUNG|nr:hypothetical protein INT48_001060 [Thamnidium elegans]
MTPSLKEESNSTLDNSTNSSEINNNHIAIDTQREKLVQGPDGNNILCDSPAPSELPLYADPDNVSSQSLKEASKRRSPSSTRRSTSIERVKPKRVIGNFTLINTLGSGSMGKVRLAVHNITGEKLAVKIVPRKAKENKSSKKREKDEFREIRTIREASIMLLLHHPYIVSLKEMVILDPYYYMFMEYVNGGQLLDYIISHGKLKEKQARQFARQIVSALDYCHRNSIVHRDLKIENILISQSGNIKIIDFGLSNLFSPRSSLSTFCGSLYFAAPELLNAKAYTGPEIDIWSFGVVLYVLVCGKVPFDDQNMPALHEKIKRGFVEYPSHLSTGNINFHFISCHLSEIIIHPWINKGYDGPVDNYLPDRVPLTLPLDMEVIRGMTGFEFGTEIDIRDKLQNIITSHEYQKAAKLLLDRTAGIHRNHRQGHLVSRFSPHTSKKSFILPNDDPQSIPAAYHPLVSIYYLVKEKLERERRLNSSSPSSSSIDLPISTSSYSLRMPDISLPENIHPSNRVSLEESLFGDPHILSGVAYSKKGKANIRVDEEGHLIEPSSTNDKLHLIENGIGRLFSRKSNSSSEHVDQDTQTRDANNVLRRLSLALSRSSTEKGTRSRKSSTTGNETTTVASSVSTPIQIPSRENETNYLSKSYAPSHSTRFPNSLFGSTQHHSAGLQQSDLDVATAAAAAASAANNSHNSNSFGNKISKILPRRMTLGQSAINAENHTNFLNIVNSHHQREGHLSSSKGPVKTLPLHIDIKSGQKQAHDHEQAFPSPVDGNSAFQQKGTADENIKPVFLKGLFSVTTTSTKHPSVIRADLIRVLERIGVKWRESKGRFECVHMPSIDLNKVINEDSNNTTEDQQSLSSDDANNPVTNTSIVPVPDLVVRFEIYIVKVPWLLGMHGLQFRRVGGDPWQYKNMCSKILAELKL